MKRIGLFGGTFDPVHRGHIETVQGVRARFLLDEVHLIPSALPPHKGTGKVTNAAHRLEMARLAVAGEIGLRVSDVELNRSGPSFTIDTVSQITKIWQNQATLFFIVGLDAFLEMDTWKSHSALFHRIAFIVMARSGKGSDDLSMMHRTMACYLDGKISRGYCFSSSRSCFTHERNKPVFIYNGPPVDISATDVRQRIRNREPFDSLVPKSVADYINAKGIYR
jgi:nicotinate-nucleotide adenylyltransferase